MYRYVVAPRGIDKTHSSLLPLMPTLPPLEMKAMYLLMVDESVSGVVTEPGDTVGEVAEKALISMLKKWIAEVLDVPEIAVTIEKV